MICGKLIPRINLGTFETENVRNMEYFNFLR